MKKICNRCKKEFDAVDHVVNTMVLEENTGETTTYWLCDQCMTAFLKWWKDGKNKDD